MMKKYIFIILLPLVFFPSCDLFEEEVNDYGKIYFRPEHMVDYQSGTSLDALFLITEKHYSSGGYQLDVDKEITDEMIKLRIKGVIEPEAGPAIMNPAHLYVDIDGLKGTRMLIISGDNFRDAYILTHTDSIITIMGPATSNTEPVLRSLKTGENIKD